MSKRNSSNACCCSGGTSCRENHATKSWLQFANSICMISAVPIIVPKTRTARCRACHAERSTGASVSRVSERRPSQRSTSRSTASRFRSRSASCVVRYDVSSSSVRRV
jgi:hypothetical protein